MKKILKISVGVIAIIIILVGVIWYKGGFESRDEVECFYYVRISPEDICNYTVYLPIVIEPGVSSSDVMKTLQITEGSAQWQIIDTEYGKALEVISNTTVVLSSSVSFDISEKTWRPTTALKDSKEQFPGNCPGLSMWNNTTATPKSMGSTWFYCSADIPQKNITILLSLENTYVDRRSLSNTIRYGFGTMVEGKIFTGWQMLDVNRGGIYAP